MKTTTTTPSDKHTLAYRGQNYTLFKREGSPKWQIRMQWRHDGKTVRKPFTLSDRLAEAQQQARAVVDDVLAGRMVPAKVRREQERVARGEQWSTLGEIVDVYLARYQARVDCSRLSQMEYVSALGRCVRAVWPGKEWRKLRADVLTAELFRKAADARVARGGDSREAQARARFTADRETKKVKALFSKAARTLFADAGLRLPDMTEWLEMPALGGYRRRGYEPLATEVVAEIERRAWAELRVEEPATFACYLLMFRAGLRNGEALHARREWLQRRTYLDKAGPREMWVVNVQESETWRPKGKRNREVPIADDVAEALLAVAGPEWLVNVPEFWPRLRVCRRRINAWLHPMLPESAKRYVGAKISYLLRKHYGSLVLTQQGIEAAQSALGHRHASTTQDHYATLMPGVLRPVLVG